MTIRRCQSKQFDLTAPIVIIGAGACGLTAALAAIEGGMDVVVLERDPTPLGTSAMSTGLIPAAGTQDQKERNIIDSPETFARDIMKKAHNEPDKLIVEKLAIESAETIEWLRDENGLELSLLNGFTYPGHSAMRMYGMPQRTGSQLMAALEARVIEKGASIVTNATAVDLYVGHNEQIIGVGYEYSDGTREEIGCQALILACCGFAGNLDLVNSYLPEIASGVVHGHPGNKGDAIIWGRELGACLADMSAYQGHGGLAVGHGIPILWPLIMEGGIQLNQLGKRFSNEAAGYSEQAVKVLQQPGGIAYSIFDQRLYELMLQFDDFQDALGAKAIIRVETIEDLAEKTGMPIANLQQIFEHDVAIREGRALCPFGRDFSELPVLTPPYYAARVTGALFHTQGGLEVTPEARVKKSDGSVFSNLFAGGGAARGISGSGADGYLAGNGLITAVGLGKIAGREAAKLALKNQSETSLASASLS